MLTFLFIQKPLNILIHSQKFVLNIITHPLPPSQEGEYECIIYQFKSISESNEGNSR